MSLDSEEVLKIAHLARLSVSEDETASYVKDLSNILELVEKMNAANVEDISPMSHPLNMSQRLRADEVTETDQKEQLMANAPSSENGLFLVPKVIE
ncbi:MAG TPA: Asp-tRNA(Asn)/Glu-tRNA(Gln) amidotransferase subunit GatC [Crenotrichaceae bacterium]|nr:Asp-tRNA(Asn)/Glu-tRNA(Gln) amidotransferase subunit GatC [Crenotrichaceae bacterium]